MRSISIALATKLIELYDPNIVAPQNGQFTPTVGQMWISEEVTPLARFTAKIKGGTSAFNYVEYRVGVHTPVGTNRFSAFDEVDKLLAHFPSGLRLTHDGQPIEIYRTTVSKPYSDDSWFSIDVIIRVRYLTA
jgi:hypothetical protein